MSKLISSLVNYVKNLWATEPLRVLAVIAAAVVFVASNFGVVIDETTLLNALIYAAGVLGLGEVGRSQVTPAK